MNGLRGDWRQIGTVSVDSGTLMLVDPCYVDDGFDYDGWCDKFGQGDDGVEASPVPLSLAFSTAYGDGEYPVYGRYDKYGKLTAVMVDTDPEEEEN